MSKTVELIFSFKASNQQFINQLKSNLQGVTVAVNETDKAFQQIKKSGKGVEDSFTAQILKADLLSKAITRVGGAMKDYVKDAATYAARTDQLLMINDSLARINGLSVMGVRNQAEEVRKLNITTQASLETTLKLMQARLNVSNAPLLARVAQDAAKVGGTSSSDALETIITSISTGQVRPLHNLGLMVSFGGAARQYAAANHLGNAGNLTNQQLAQARLQAVLQAGIGINGAYEASLTTAGGQMQSLSRYTDELKNSFGEGLQPALLDVIGLMRSLSTEAKQNVDHFQNLTAGVTALGVGITTTATLATLLKVPLPAAAAVGTAAGFGAYLELHQDPAKSTVKAAQMALSDFDIRQIALKNENSLYHSSNGAQGLSDSIYQQLTANSGKARENITEETVIRLATIQKQRRDRIAAMSPVERAQRQAEYRDSVLHPNNPFGKLTDDYTFSPLPDASALGITQERIDHALEAPANGNLQPSKLPDDDAIQALNQVVNERGKALRSQLNAARIAMLSGTARIAAQTAFSRSELARSFTGVDPKLLNSPEVGQLYSLINQVGAADLAKYNRDQAIDQAGFGAQLAFAGRPALSGRYVAPGDLTDATGEYNSARATAFAKFRAGGFTDIDSFRNAFQSAELTFTGAKRSAQEASNRAAIDERVQRVRSDSSLALRQLGVLRTNDNAGGSIESEYQVRIAAAQKEFEITGNIVELRKQATDAETDKRISMLEKEKQQAERMRADQVQLIQSEGNFRMQMIGVTGTPGDQFTAIRERYKDQLQTAIQIFDVRKESGDLEHAQADLRQSSLAAEHDMVLAIAQLRRQSLEDYQNGVARLFDAATSGNPSNGIRNLAVSAARSIGRRAVVGMADLAYGTFQHHADALGNMIHGQVTTGPDGSPQLTRLGRVLAGTPLGVNQANLAKKGLPDHQDTAILSNTRSTDRNTDAIDRLTARITGILGSGRGGFGGNFGRAIHSLPGFSTAFSSNSLTPFVSSSMSFGDDGGNPINGFFPQTMSDMPVSLPPGIVSSNLSYGDAMFGPGGAYSPAVYGGPTMSDMPVNLPLAYDPYSGLPVSAPGSTANGGAYDSAVGMPSGLNSNNSNLARGVGIAGAAAAGGFAAYDQFRHNDVRGDIGGVGALAGTAGSIMMLAGATGPAAPILAGVGLALGVVSSLMGDPKKNFANQQQQDLAANRFFGPQALSVNSDANGNMVGADFRGNLRSSPYDAYGFSVSPSHYDTNTKAGQYNVVPGQVTDTYRPSVTIQADFIDPAGLMARSNDIADAVNTAMNRGHAINQTVAQQSK